MVHLVLVQGLLLVQELPAGHPVDLMPTLIGDDPERQIAKIKIQVHDPELPVCHSATMTDLATDQRRPLRQIEILYLTRKMSLHHNFVDTIQLASANITQIRKIVDSLMDLHANIAK